MEISTLTLKLIILLVPGALATLIYKKLTVRQKESSDFMFVIFSIMFGLFSYLFLQIGSFIISLIEGLCITIKPNYEILKTFSSLSDGSQIPFKEVIWASIISILLGLSISCLDHKKLLNRFARFLHISNKYGDENLFTYFLNSPDISWVYIRDIEHSITYLGSVSSFSETTEYKEIVLVQVTVYSYPESIELYDLDRIYLVFPKDKMIIEQAKIKSNE